MVKPVGYKVQKGIACCNNCWFSVEFADSTGRTTVCEIMGESDSGSIEEDKVDPLGICDAHKFNL